jgi:hypothetical protein
MTVTGVSFFGVRGGSFQKNQAEKWTPWSAPRPQSVAETSPSRSTWLFALAQRDALHSVDVHDGLRIRPRSTRALHEAHATQFVYRDAGDVVQGRFCSIYFRVGKR